MFLMVDDEEEGVKDSSGNFKSDGFGDGLKSISMLLLFLLFTEELNSEFFQGDAAEWLW